MMKLNSIWFQSENKNISETVNNKYIYVKKENLKKYMYILQLFKKENK